MSSVAARFFGPQVSGIGTTPSSVGNTSVFRIDHDELFNQTTHLQYQIGKNGPWIGFSWRYDSGLVAGPIPCAGGDCANGPLGSDSVVDVSALTPDQQYEAGLSVQRREGYSHYSHQSQRSVSGFAIHIFVGEDSRRRH